MKVKAFITHKQSECYADCQDRFYINKDNRRVAVSDGMSQSIFSDYWANLLASHYANNGHCTDDDRKGLCSQWLQYVETYRDEQIKKGHNPWKLNNFLAEHKGAGATICGIEFKNATDWTGHVLGDSCIIRVNTQGMNIEILSSEEKPFDYFPDFYDSYPEKEGRGTIKEVSGSISPNDILLLVTDPFSEFLDRHKKDCREFVRQMLSIENHSDFCTLVNDWRAKGMHNDDSTLCIIKFDNEP